MFKSSDDIDIKKLTEKQVWLLSYHLFSGLGEYWMFFLKLLDVPVREINEAAEKIRSNAFYQALFCFEKYLKHTPSLKWSLIRFYLISMKRDDIVEDIESLVLKSAQELQESEIKVDYEMNHEVKTMEHGTDVSATAGVSAEQIGPCVEESCVEPQSTQSVLLSPRNTVVSGNDDLLKHWIKLDKINDFKFSVQANRIDVKKYRFADKSSILHVAFFNSVKIAHWLLDEKILDINVQNDFGNTPLHFAVGKGNIGVTEHLLKYGANVNPSNYQNMTPLLIAVKNDNFPMAELLLKHNPDLEAKDENELTVLHYAVKMKNYELVSLLLDNNANVDAKDKSLQTALHYVAIGNKPGPYYDINLKIAMLLLLHNADVNAQDNNKKQPLDYCPEKERPMRQLFLNNA